MTASTWPLTASRNVAGALTVGGISTDELADQYGTPLWVVDEADFRERCRRYRDAFTGATVAYAAKAWSAIGILQLATQEGLWIDVASGGELHAAMAAGVPPETVAFHGNNKSDDELRMAAEFGVGRVVIDSFDEIARLQATGEEASHTFQCWLRVTPGIDAHTHEYVRTGHDDTKFGFTLSLGLAEAALVATLGLSNVDVVGVHAHIGSQIFGTEPFVANAELMVGLLADWRDRHDIVLSELNLGGGMAIPYTHEDHPVTEADYGEAVVLAVTKTSTSRSIAVPRLFVEPGRAIVGPSTITLYRVGTIKQLPGIRTYVSVDGGMSDNIRPALYEAEHETGLANRNGSAQLAAFTVVGKHCESGDLVRERASLPDDLAIGDVLAVAATGAYTEAMASNYNRVPRPGAVLVKDGKVRELIRRESIEDLMARDVELD